MIRIASEAEQFLVSLYDMTGDVGDAGEAKDSADSSKASRLARDVRDAGENSSSSTPMQQVSLLRLCSWTIKRLLMFTFRIGD